MISPKWYCLVHRGQYNHQQEVKKFVIVITSYNNKEWYKENLSSVFKQNYQNYRVIYIDDCSKDYTGDLVKEFVEEQHQTDRVILIKNEIWKSQMANHYIAAHMCDDDEIIVHLDGDDWFSHPNVLTHLNTLYQNPNIWMTYGQCQIWPHNQKGPSQPIPQEALACNDFRNTTWWYGHLRTFYAWLFKLIKLQDLIHESSFKTMSPSPDVAIMIPMLEMSYQHTQFVEEILYIWNSKNPISQVILSARKQWNLIITVQSWPRYHALAKPIKNKVNEYESKTADVILILQDQNFSYNKLLEFITKNKMGLHKLYIFSPYPLNNQENKYQILDIPVIEVLYQKNNNFALKDKLICHTPLFTDHIILSDGQNFRTESFDITTCIKELEKTQALAFYFNVVSGNTTDDIYFSPNIGAWQFKYAKNKWSNPYTLDLVLYRKSHFIQMLRTVTAQNFLDFQLQWDELNTISSLVDRNVGLFLR